AIGLDLAVAGVLDHAHRQFEGAQIAEEAGHAHHFAGGVRERLALLAGQDTREFVGVGFDRIRHPGHELAALLDRRGGPGRVGGLGGGNGLVELVLGRAWALRQDLFGGGIEDRHGLVAGYHFAVDEKIVVAHWLSLPVNGPFAASLCFIVYHVCGGLATLMSMAAGRKRRYRYIL